MSSINEGTLSNERSKSGICVKELTSLLDGSSQNTLLKEKFYTLFERESVFKTRLDGLDARAVRSLVMKRVARVVSIANGLTPEERDRLYTVLYAICPHTATRLGVHTGLFGTSIKNNGNEEQVAEYRDKIDRAEILGCFAMTELGHGSNAAGLETTAHLVEEVTPEGKQDAYFVINTPSLTATKWWIGGAAETATHAVVFARLIFRGTDYGVHSFVVPLRDPKTFQQLPGIRIGDCGSKLGLNGVDNGYIQFNQVKVPVKAMLSRYARLDLKNGKYETEGRMSLALQRVALIGARVGILAQSACSGAKAVTIAIRYGASRRQFGAAKDVSVTGNKALEQQILDYPTHQYRLFTILAEVYALQFSSLRLFNAYFFLIHSLSNGDQSTLNDTHNNAACMKAFSSWKIRDAIMITRDTCGGHGYSSYSGLPGIIQDFQVQTTWDGDNTVLALQTARYLINTFLRVAPSHKTDRTKGKSRRVGDREEIKGDLKFFESWTIILSEKYPSGDRALLSSSNHLRAFQWRILNICHRIQEQIQVHVTKGSTLEQAFHFSQVDMIDLCRAYYDLYNLTSFHSVLSQAEELKETSAEVMDLMKLTSLLYGLVVMERDIGFFRDHDYMSFEQSKLVRRSIMDICSQIRRHAVVMVDGFNFPDFVLGSQLAAYDGNVYQRYFDEVKSQDHYFNHGQVPPYWESLIKPLTNVSKL